MTGRVSTFGWFLRSRGVVVVLVYLIAGVACARQLGGDLVAVPMSAGRSVDVGIGTSSLCGLIASVVFSSPDPQRERAFPDVPIRVMRVGWAVIVLVWPAVWVVLFNLGRSESLRWVLLDQSPFDALSLAMSAVLVVVGLVLQWHTPGPPR